MQPHIVHKYFYFQYFHLQQIDKDPSEANFEENQGTAPFFIYVLILSLESKRKHLGTIKVMRNTQRNK